MSQNVFLTFLDRWPTVHWCFIFTDLKNVVKKCLAFAPSVIMLCFVIFSPTLSNPMLHFSIIPHWPQMGLAVFFFSALLVCCTFLSSLISCVEGGIWCLFWPMWCFGLELLPMRESQTLFLSSPQLPQSTAGHHSTSISPAVTPLFQLTLFPLTFLHASSPCSLSFWLSDHLSSNLQPL